MEVALTIEPNKTTTAMDRAAPTSEFLEGHTALAAAATGSRLGEAVTDHAAGHGFGHAAQPMTWTSAHRRGYGGR